MPTSDPEARRRTSANSNDAITSVKLFISRSRNCPTNFSLSILKRVSPKDDDKLKLVGHSPQFQSRQTKQSKQNCQNQKAEDNFRLFPPHHLKVVMQRRHLKNAPAHPAG